MFKSLIDAVEPIIGRIEHGLFEKDNIFSNNKILAKGVSKESIQEDSDEIILKKEFTSADNSFNKIEVTRMSKESFITQIANNNTLEETQLRAEISVLQNLMKENSREQQFEKCAILRDKIHILSKVITIKKQ